MIEYDPYSEDEHRKMDTELLQSLPVWSEFFWDGTLALIVEICFKLSGRADHLNAKYQDKNKLGGLLDSCPDLKEHLKNCYEKRSFKDIRNLGIAPPKLFRRPSIHLPPLWQQFLGACTPDSPLSKKGTELAAAYSSQFVGNTVSNFIDHIIKIDDRIRTGNLVVYARAISLVQSSGTGKSRLLTEVGREVFTLPICLRRQKDPGYPRGDDDVSSYLEKYRTNDLSLSAHAAVACFFGAAFETMLRVLKERQRINERVGDTEKPLVWWHRKMENRDYRKERGEFYKEVVNKACLKRDACGQPAGPRSRESDRRTPTEVTQAAKTLYTEQVAKPLEDLMSFLRTATSNQNAMCFVYFDEAQEMESLIWVVLRVLACQKDESMFSVFMGTKSEISYFAPPMDKMFSLRLREEVSRLIAPYIATGFDQYITKRAKSGNLIAKTSELQTIAHLATYGRPLWYAHVDSGHKAAETVALAAWKLTNVEEFDVNSMEQVFAILSQRLCLEPVLVNAEADKLAERSVADHMRLITGISDDRRMLYTRCPSEPILALAAAKTFYGLKPKDRISVMNTLTTRLHEPGLIEKGLVGELGARILLLFARDYAAGAPADGIGLLKPSSVPNFFKTLLGPEWGGNNRKEFDSNFEKAYVNFTHWAITDYPLPAKPDRLFLANLWARGTALQCMFTQEAVNFMIVTYHGSITEADDKFCPSLLSAMYGQVKFKCRADTKAESEIAPIGLSRSASGPLPYIALLMELGTEAYLRESKSKILLTLPGSIADSYSTLKARRDEAELKWEAARLQPGVIGRKRKRTTDERELEQRMQFAQAEIDSYNRFAITVRGASSDVYDVLKTANISDPFAALLRSTLLEPTPESRELARMNPFGSSGDPSVTDWMIPFVEAETSDDEAEEMDDI